MCKLHILTQRRIDLTMATIFGYSCLKSESHLKNAISIASTRLYIGRLVGPSVRPSITSKPILPQPNPRD